MTVFSKKCIAQPRQNNDQQSYRDRPCYLNHAPAAMIL